MNVLKWIKGLFSDRGRAMSRYERGMAKARLHDHQGAVEEYSAMIDDRDTPADLIAMALFNRALVLVAMGEVGKGTADLDAVIAMQGAPAQVKTSARQKLARIETRSVKESR